MVNNCSEYILYFEIPLGLYYVGLSMYEFYIIHKYYQKNNIEEVLIFILCKAIFNALIIPINLINLINIKFIRFINFILGLSGTVEWRLYNGQNNDYENILFLEFIMFQFIYSVYFIYYLCRINNHENVDTNDETTNLPNIVENRQGIEEINNRNIHSSIEIQMVDVIKIDDIYNNKNIQPIDKRLYHNNLHIANLIENPIINVNGIIFTEEDEYNNIYEYRYTRRNYL
jgi:hypothetical protein